MNVILYITVAACTLVACGFADGGELQLAGNNTAVCSHEIQQQIANMSMEEKSRELQKLQAQNTSALQMMNTLSGYARWDEFLCDLPIMVTNLSQLMLFSNERDFTLYKDNVTYHYIQRPESFRASLVQKNARNQHLLNLQLNRIKKFAVQNRQVCEDSISKINDTINLIHELQIATVSAQSDQKDRLKLLTLEREAFERKLNASSRKLQLVNEELTRQRDNVKQRQKEYEKAQRNAEPNVGLILLSAVVDIVEFIPRLILGTMGHGGSSGGGQQGQMPPINQPAPLNMTFYRELGDLQEAKNITKELGEILNQTMINKQTQDTIELFIADVMTFQNCSLKNSLLSFLEKVRMAYKAVGGVSEEDRFKMLQKLFEISNEVTSKLSKFLSGMSNGQTIVLNHRLETMFENSDDTYGQIMGPRLEQLAGSTRILIIAQEQYERSYERMLQVMDEKNKYFGEVQTINIEAIDFKSILKVMKHGIEVLGHHIEQWKNLLEFFKVIENLTKLASEETRLFIEGTYQGIEDGALMSVYGNDDIYMDILYQHSYTTIDIARALNEMTTTYVHVSRKYVFPHLNGVTELLALEDPKEINAAFKKVAVDAQLAMAEIRKELKEDYIKQQQRMKVQIDRISCFMNVLKDDPSIEKAVKENGYDVGINGF
ncbi:unnamed protein product [Anisakis simplex]|uniref:Secreted protein n=1 Tax=Anisakis simplex TaxID=6269 RepID=A0A0M3IZ57_ANISI|nr:unnamed protein product [Anisakis simplex]